MSKRKLNEKQYAAIAILSQPNRGGLTYKQVAEEVGVSEQTIHNWRKLDYFNEEIKKHVLRNAVDSLPEIFDSIPRHIVDDGNAAMLRTYLQALGMLTEKVEVNDASKNDSVDEMKAKLAEIRERNKDED